MSRMKCWLCNIPLEIAKVISYREMGKKKMEYVTARKGMLVCPECGRVYV